MNSKDAKQINLIDFICRLCRKEDIVSLQENKALFKHPLRTDNQASLSVFINRENGNWSYKDWAFEKKGNIIDFVIDNYNEVTNTSEALKKICEVMGIADGKKYIPVVYENSDNRENNTNSNITIKKINELNNMALIEYLQERKIEVSIAKKYLKEIYFSINKDGNIKSYFGLAFKNRCDGYEIRNKYSKNNIIVKDISIFYANDEKNPTEKILIFEGFMNFLSALTYYKTFKSKYDVIVLNSTTQIEKAIEVIVNNKYISIYDYLDNDSAGRLCQNHLKNGLTIAFEKKKINYLPKIINSFSIYQPHNDFNDFLLSR